MQCRSCVGWWKAKVLRSKFQILRKMSLSPVSTEYTYGFLITDNKKTLEGCREMIKYQNRHPHLMLHFLPIDIKSEEMPTPTENYLPVITNSKFHRINFSKRCYYKLLQTKILGRSIIYSDVLATTMNFSCNDTKNGFVVATRRQTKGRGRKSDEWVSLVGGVMFNLHLQILQNSILGSRIPLLQHIIAVAMVLAVKSNPEYQDIPLKIKWPNDIYMGQTHKIGGIIVRTEVGSSIYYCNIGVGINLSNSEPTTCINDAILTYNKCKNKSLKIFAYEEYMALVFNQLENLLSIVQSNNFQHFYDLYYKHWLHRRDEEINVTDSNGFLQKGNIIDIDENGFLRIAVKVKGQEKDLILHPDANSFNYAQGSISSI